MNRNVADLTTCELKDGFTYDKMSEIFECLFCGKTFEQGVIYTFDDYFVDARRAIESHIDTEHGSVFHMLLSEDKRSVGLTDTQKNILTSFYDGLSDKDIAKASGTSASTIRYQRFSFREKAKQAKIILALSELLEEKLRRKNITQDAPLEIHESATMVDERYMVTDAEAAKIIKTFFTSISPPVLKTFSSKEKNKLVILKVIAEQFEDSKKYTEKQVNEIIKAIYSDYATIRRYLIEYGFMGRKSDGSEYWLK